MSSDSINKRNWDWNTWTWTACTALTALALSSCSGAGDAAGVEDDSGDTPSLNLYAPSNLPARFSVEVPDSLDDGEAAEGTGGTARIIARKAERQLHQRISSKAKSESARSAVKFGKRGIRADADGDGYDDETYEYVGFDSYEYTAMGYYELQNIVSQMSMKKQDVAMNFLMADAIFDDVVEACAFQDLAAGACMLPAGTLSMTFTVEMANFIIASMGVSPDDEYYDMYSEMFRDLIGWEMPVPGLSYSVLDGSAGYDHSLTIDNGSWEGYSSHTTLSWDDARTRVELVYGYGSTEWGEGTDSYSYNDIDKIVVYRNMNSYGGTSWTYAMTLQEDTSRADTHGVFFSVRSDYTDAQSNYVMDIVGLADDDGGYAESEYTSTYTPITVTAGADNLTAYESYYIVAGETCPTTMDWSTVQGSIYAYSDWVYDESYGWIQDGVTADAYLWGGTLPSPYSVCSYSYDFSYDEDTGEYSYTEILTPVSGTVTLSAGETVTYKYRYSEGFDGDGTLTFSAYSSYDIQLDENGEPQLDGSGNPVYAWTEYYYEVGTSETSSDYEYVEYYDDATSSGDFIETPTYSLEGPVEDLDPNYQYVVFTKDGEIPDDYWNNVIGYAYYDSWANCTYDDAGEYTCGEGSWVTYVWGTAEEAAISTAYIYGYSDYDYSWSYDLTDEFSLSLSVD